MPIFAHSKFASSQIKIEPQTHRYNWIQCYSCFFINKEYFTRQDFTLTGIDPENTTFTINHKCLVWLSHVKPKEASSQYTLLPFLKTSSFNCKLNPSFSTFWTGFYMLASIVFYFRKYQNLFMTFSPKNLFTDTLLVFYKNKLIGLFVEWRVTPLKEKRNSLAKTQYP